MVTHDWGVLCTHVSSSWGDEHTYVCSPQIRHLEQTRVTVLPVSSLVRPMSLCVCVSVWGRARGYLHEYKVNPN